MGQLGSSLQRLGGWWLTSHKGTVYGNTFCYIYISFKFPTTLNKRKYDEIPSVLSHTRKVLFNFPCTPYYEKNLLLMDDFFYRLLTAFLYFSFLANLKLERGKKD